MGLGFEKRLMFLIIYIHRDIDTYIVLACRVGGYMVFLGS